MKILSPDHLLKLQHTIEELEESTSAEVVVVLADSASNYTYVHLCHAAVAAIFVPVLAVIALPIDWYLVISLQVSVFAFLALILQYSGIAQFAVPRSIRDAHTSKLARDQMVERNITSSPNRRGVLIFVAYQEKHVEIIPDIGVLEKVDQAIWDQIAADTKTLLRTRGVMLAFQFAVEKCKEVLIDKFPVDQGDLGNRKTLPNQLVLI